VTDLGLRRVPDVVDRDQTNRFRAAVAGAGIIANWQSSHDGHTYRQMMIRFFGASVYTIRAVYENVRLFRFSFTSRKLRTTPDPCDRRRA